MLRRVSLPLLAAVTTVAAAFTLIGCSSTPQPKAADSTAATTAVATQELTGNPWHWVATQTPVEWIVPADPALYTIQFNPDGSAVLRADCNRGRGTYTTGEGGSLAIGPVAITRAMCPPGSLDTKYLQQLSNVAHYFFRGDTLYIDQKIDSGTMRFVRGPAASE
jgi:para-nitrobenzyl esterase